MRIGIATVQVPFVDGGAESHAAGLRQAFIEAGHEAEIISVPFKWYPPERIPEHILACRLLDVSESSGMKIDKLIGLKFPAYLMPHPDKTLWILHQHRPAYDLWGEPHGDLHLALNGETVRDVIRSADTRLIPEARRIFANSRNVAARLERFCGLDAEPLYHPPPDAEMHRSGDFGAYFFMPSRINGPKRQDLVVEALFHTARDVRVVFAGTADEPTFARRVRARAAQLDPGRVEWLGKITAERKIDLFSGCRAVIYPPLDEDYGYVTLEAMLSAKPVVTCGDSGGPLEFITHEDSGLVVDAEPRALAAALDRLHADAAFAGRLGESARARYSAMDISWDRVVRCLVG